MGTRPKRFWQRILNRLRPRFGLRTLLVLVTITSVLTATIATWYQRGEQQRRIVAQLIERGASVTYDAEYQKRFSQEGRIVFPHRKHTWSERFDVWVSDKFGNDAVYDVRAARVSGPNSEQTLPLVAKLPSIVKLDLSAEVPWTELSDGTWSELLRCEQLQVLKLERASRSGRRLAGLAKLSELKQLTIKSGELTIEDVREIAKLSQLKKLNLELVHTSDDALQPLSALTGLEEFHLVHAGLSETVTNRGVAVIASMPRLRKLTLARMPLIDDQAMQNIAGLSQLTYLNLDQAGVAGTEFGCLTGLPLTTLDLIGTQTEDQAITHLLELKQLINLDLGHTKITDAGASQLEKMTQLKSLNLSRTEITDKTLEHLQSLPLQRLYIESTNVSDAGIDSLLKIKTLDVVGFANTKITAQETIRFKTQRPECQVR